MVPFDPVALLAMLLAFYPVVGPAALLRARAERPDYFAGGEIRGTKGDKLWLPDGRKYDLIFATGSPAQHWQVLGPLPDGAGAAPDDPFALEDGPLARLDPARFVLLPRAPEFQPLVAAAVAEWSGHDTALATAHASMVEGADPIALDLAGGELDGAEGALGPHHALLDQANPADVIGTTDAHGATIDSELDALDEIVPGPIDPHVPTPRPPPRTPPDFGVPPPQTE